MEKVVDKVKAFFIDNQHSEHRKLISSSSCLTDNEFIKTIIQLPKSNIDCILGKDVMSDIEMFKPYRDDTDDTAVYQNLNCCKMKGSELYLKHLLNSPITNVNTLLRRQQILQKFEDNLILESTLSRMKEHESNILWLFESREENVNALYEMVYFRFWLFKKLNNMESALTSYNIYRIILSPVIGILSPIIYFIIPYLVLRIKFGFKVGLINYLKLMFQTSKVMFEMNAFGSRLRYVSYIFSLIFYFQGVFNSIEISKTLHNISDFIISKMKSISDFINDANQVVDTYYHQDIPKMFFSIEKNNEENKSIILPPLNKRYWMFTNFGKVLKNLKSLDKENVKVMLSKVYMIDCVNSVIILKKYNLYTYVDYADGDTPRLNMNGVWHPSIIPKNVVKNDVRLDTNMLITGPNAGGKSTLVKSVLLNVIFAQTLGITACDSCSLTPFKFINSQINIPDCKGKESLFQAEMNRCKYNFDIVKSLDRQERGLIIMDEILSSTNPVEGISGSYAILKKLSEFSNCLMICTTHYSYLTKLSKTKRFKNYKVIADKSSDGQIIFTYKLQKGISKQYIALDLLESNGFDKDLINEAKIMRDRLVA